MGIKKDTIWWSRWFSRATFLAFLSSGMLALSNINDKHVMQNIIVGSDNISATLVYLLIGSWAGVLISIVNNVVFGRRIEPDYPGMTFGSRKMQLLAIASGILGAVAMSCQLKATQDLDPSVIIALASMALVYLVIYDALWGNISWRKIRLALLAVMVGAFFASVKKLEFSLAVFSWGAVLLLVVGRSGLRALGSIADQAGSRRSDGVTFSFWRRVWFAIAATALALALSFVRGRWIDFTTILTGCFWVALLWAGLSLFFDYFGGTLRTTANRYGAVSVVTMITNFKVVLGIPLTLAVSVIWSGIFGKIPSDVNVWAVRVTGVLILFWGINCLRKTERE